MRAEGDHGTEYVTLEDMKERLSSRGIVGRNPGSFEDLHLSAVKIFPKLIHGLKVSLFHRLGYHSQLHHNLNVGTSKLWDFDCRWYGDRFPLHGGLAAVDEAVEKLRHERDFPEVARRLGQSRARITGETVGSGLSVAAINFKSILAEYVGNKWTIGFMARNLILGQDLPLDLTSESEVLSLQNLPEMEVQAMFSVNSRLDLGLQCKKTFINFNKYLISEVDSMTALGLGARVRLSHNHHITASMSRGVGDLYLNSELSKEFQVAIGCHYKALDELYSETTVRVGCKFTAPDRGLVIRLGADSCGQIVSSVGKKVTAVSFPCNIIFSAKCDTDPSSRSEMYKFGLGVEASL